MGGRLHPGINLLLRRDISGAQLHITYALTLPLRKELCTSFPEWLEQSCFCRGQALVEESAETGLFRTAG